MRRTSKEILDRIKAEAKRDLIGTIQFDLASYLPYEEAKQFLAPAVTEEDWLERECADPMVQVAGYLLFAWGKANQCQALSVARSMDHCSAWLWLAGYGKVVDQHFHEYDHYGKRQFVIASELSGFDWRSHDNGRWEIGEGEIPLASQLVAAYVDEATRIARKAVNEIETPA